MPNANDKEELTPAQAKREADSDRKRTEAADGFVGSFRPSDGNWVAP